MNRILIIGLLFATVVSTTEAAPRGRRARRRARQTSSQATVRSNSASTYYRSPTATAPQPVQQPRYVASTYVGSASTPSSTAVASYPSQNVVAPPTIQPSVVQPTYAPSPRPVSYQPAQLAARTTTYKPIVSDVPRAPVVLAKADSLPSVDSLPTVNSPATAIPVQPTSNQVVQAAALEPIPDPLLTLKGGGSLTQPEPYCASCTVIPAGKSFNSALAELNGIRASKGLPALVEDPNLSALAHQKASIQANRGAMYHPGGSMGNARFEGVGMGPRFTTCYQDATNVTYAGAATVVGRNGQRYHCLLVR